VSFERGETGPPGRVTEIFNAFLQELAATASSWIATLWMY
jgi:hypothetical protein